MSERPSGALRFSKTFAHFAVELGMARLPQVEDIDKIVEAGGTVDLPNDQQFLVPPYSAIFRLGALEIFYEAVLKAQGVLPVSEEAKEQLVSKGWVIEASPEEITAQFSEEDFEDPTAFVKIPKDLVMSLIEWETISHNLQMPKKARK